MPVWCIAERDRQAVRTQPPNPYARQVHKSRGESRWTISKAPDAFFRDVASDLSRFPPGSVAGLRRIGRAVGNARRERGLSQISVARAIGVSQPTISRIENGRLATASLHRLGAIIEVLGGEILIR